MTTQVNTKAPEVKLVERRTGGTLGELHRKAAIDTYLLTLNDLEKRTMFVLMFGHVALEDHEHAEGYGKQLCRSLSFRQELRLSFALQNPNRDIPEIGHRSK